MNLDRTRVAVTALAVGVVAAAVHWPGVENGFLHWDDHLHLDEVQQHPRLSWGAVQWAFTTMQPFSYYPMTRLLTVFNRQLWGLQPAGFHATSIILHGLNGALVTSLVWLLVGAIPTVASRARLALAGGVALVFAIHPLQVEPVCWFAQQMTLLSAFFSLACLCAYVITVRGGGPPATTAAVGQTAATTTRWRWWAMTGLFAAALLSKSVAVSLPLVMLVLDFYPLRRHLTMGWRQLLWEKVWLGLLSIAMAAQMILAGSRVHAVVGLERLGLLERGLVAARGIVFYLWKLLWPAWLSPYYPLQGEVTLREPEFTLSVAACVLITIVCVWVRNRQPAPLAGWVATLVLILPVSGLIQIGRQAAADRYMYLAMLPLLLLAAGGCLWLWDRLHHVGRTALAVLLGCYLAVFAVRTRDQIAVWRDDVTLWSRVLSIYPNSATLNINLAKTLVKQARFDEAQEPAQRAVQLSPDSAEAWALLGVVCSAQGQHDEAENQLKAALRLDPTLWAAEYNLACLYSKMGNFEAAYNALRDVISAEPKFALVARRDPDLAALRESPLHGKRFAELVSENTSR